MIRTLAFAGLFLASAIAFGGAAHDDTLFTSATANCAPMAIDDGSGDQCHSPCDNLDTVAEVYRKATGDDVHCTQ